jgi:hypothetical protein
MHHFRAYRIYHPAKLSVRSSRIYEAPGTTLTLFRQIAASFLGFARSDLHRDRSKSGIVPRRVAAKQCENLFGGGHWPEIDRTIGYRQRNRLPGRLTVNE